MNILVCGDRNWNNLEIIMRELKCLPRNATIIHGAARGADTMAGLAAEHLGMTVKSFPAKWHKYGRSAGPIRNREMFNSTDPDLVLAFHTDIEHSKGTKDMIRYAEKRGCITKIIDK